MEPETELERLERERSEAVLALNDSVDPRWVGSSKAPLGEPHLRTVNLRQPTELWWRNPQQSPKLLREAAFPRYVLSVNTLRYAPGGPYRMLTDALPATVDWKLWVVSNDYAHLYDRTTEPDKKGTMTPLRRAPVWQFGTDPEDLVKLCRAYESAGWDRIFLSRMPIVRGKREGDSLRERNRVYDYVHRVGAAFPHVRLHVHGQNNWRASFGLNFQAADIDPYFHSAKLITLPNGRVAICVGKDLHRHLKWIHVLGFDVPSLRTQHGRIAFNLHSAMWAAENYSSEEALAKTRHHNPSRTDPLGLYALDIKDEKRTKYPLGMRMRMPVHDPDKQPQMAPVREGKVEPYHLAEPIVGLPLVPVKPRADTKFDKVLCDPCTLKDKCRHFRDGGLCILPRSPSSDLARLFNTRDADQVREALSSVLQHQAERLSRISDSWDGESVDELGTDEVIKRSEHQMKLENSLARSSEAMIKILDPSQRTPSTIPAINATQINVYNPAVLVANVVKKLEEAGIDRSKIKPEMIIEAAREAGAIE